jgi:hypothetical protein
MAAFERRFGAGYEFGQPCRLDHLARGERRERTWCDRSSSGEGLCSSYVVDLRRHQRGRCPSASRTAAAATFASSRVDTFERRSSLIAMQPSCQVELPAPSSSVRRLASRHPVSASDPLYLQCWPIRALVDAASASTQPQPVNKPPQSSRHPCSGHRRVITRDGKPQGVLSIPDQHSATRVSSVDIFQLPVDTAC